MWKDLISESQMGCRLGNRIRFRSQTGLQVWRTYSDNKGIERAWRTLKRISKSQLKRV
jgi:hypothetical protein